jgi:transcriptional regulator with XRE-family HTH domain
MRREPEPEIAALGKQLRAERLRRGLTLKEIEARAQVSRAYVSEVERGAASPSLGCMTRIARALDLDPAVLLARRPEPGPVLARNSGKRELRFGEGDVVVEALLGPSSGIAIGAYFLELAPGARLSERDLDLGPVEMITFVMSGRMRFRLRDREHTLEEGDTAHFSVRGAKLALMNPSAPPARLLWVTYPRLAW